MSIDDDIKCPNCNSENIEWCDRSYICLECGTFFKFDGNIVGIMEE